MQAEGRRFDPARIHEGVHALNRPDGAWQQSVSAYVAQWQSTPLVRVRSRVQLPPSALLFAGMGQEAPGLRSLATPPDPSLRARTRVSPSGTASAFQADIVGSIPTTRSHVGLVRPPQYDVAPGRVALPRLRWRDRQACRSKDHANELHVNLRYRPRGVAPACHAGSDGFDPRVPLSRSPWRGARAAKGTDCKSVA